MIVANEWLDDLPVEVVEHATDGPRRVLVDPETGDETLGPLVDGPDAVWLAEWWPLDTSGIGDRAEVGRPRDTAWSAAVRSLTRGVAIAIDYRHDRGDRAGRDVVGGHAHGLRRRPTRPAGAERELRRHQSRRAGRMRRGRRPQWRIVVVARPATRGPPRTRCQRRKSGADLAERDRFPTPRALTRTSEAAELVRRGGLGDFGWLVQCVGVPLPSSLAALRD